MSTPRRNAPPRRTPAPAPSLAPSRISKSSYPNTMILFASATARKYGRNGFIVVAVLWILAALATLASIYASYVANTVVASRANDERVQAQALISAAVELAAYQLTASSAQTRPTHGAFNFRAGPANVAC